MTDSTRPPMPRYGSGPTPHSAPSARRRARRALCALGVSALLGGCAQIGGPAVHTEMVAQDTYLLLGKYTANSDTVAVLDKQMTQRADRQCPGGWTKLAESPNPHASTGGKIWKIQCAPTAANRAAPAADAGFAVAPPAAPAQPPATSAGPAQAPIHAPLLTLLTEAARRAAPDISAQAAEAIARAQLQSLAAAGITLTDASGHKLPTSAK